MAINTRENSRKLSEQNKEQEEDQIKTRSEIKEMHNQLDSNIKEDQEVKYSQSGIEKKTENESNKKSNKENAKNKEDIIDTNIDLALRALKMPKDYEITRGRLANSKERVEEIREGPNKAITEVGRIFDKKFRNSYSSDNVNLQLTNLKSSFEQQEEKQSALESTTPVTSAVNLFNIKGDYIANSISKSRDCSTEKNKIKTSLQQNAIYSNEDNEELREFIEIEKSLNFPKKPIETTKDLKCRNTKFQEYITKSISDKDEHIEEKKDLLYEKEAGLGSARKKSKCVVATEKNKNIKNQVMTEIPNILPINEHEKAKNKQKNKKELNSSKILTELPTKDAEMQQTLVKNQRDAKLILKEENKEPKIVQIRLSNTSVSGVDEKEDKKEKSCPIENLTALKSLMEAKENLLISVTLFYVIIYLASDKNRKFQKLFFYFSKKIF